MKNCKEKLILFIFLFTGIYTCSAQRINSARKIEQLIASTAQKVTMSCVKIVIRDSVNNTDFGGFSGVIAGSEGLILTAAHSVEPNKRYRVEFPDGRIEVAVSLGKISLEKNEIHFDLALLKITGNGRWPGVELGSSSNLTIGEACVGISYPGTFFKVKPNIRFGRITKTDYSSGYFESTCKMEPGDSGGALFDLDGKLIGIRSRINVNEDENFDIPIDFFKKYWSALKKPKDYRELPAADSIMKTLHYETYTIPPLKKFAVLKKKLLNNSIAVNSKKSNVKLNILATAVKITLKGKSQTVLISKSSMVGENPTMKYNGLNLPLSTVYRDSENDLVLLTFKDKNPINIGIQINALKPSDISPADLGKFLISPLAINECKIGVISSEKFDLPIRFSRGTLGALISPEDKQAIVKYIVPTSSVDGVLKIDDHITAINQVNVPDVSQYVTEISKYLAGDTIQLGILRNSKAQTIKVVLDPHYSDHITNNYEGRRSLRCDGFQNIFVQDAAIQSKECGGPVYDIKGNFLGINIARFSRTATIVMPIEVLVKFLKKAQDYLK